MFAYPLRRAALAAAAIVGLSACTSPYGYSGISMGVGNAGYYDPYYGGYGYGAGYPGYGYGYPGYALGFAPYWGWYDDFYYPGTGYYVYDTYRHRHYWTDAQRRYWSLRRERALATSTTTQPVVIRDNWEDFSRNRTTSRQLRTERKAERLQRRQSTSIESGTPVQVGRRQVERSQPVRIERQRVERPQVERRQSTESVSRQTARAERRSEVHAERASRSEERGRGKSSAE